MKILIAEDDTSLRRVLVSILQKTTILWMLWITAATLWIIYVAIFMTRRF